MPTATIEVKYHNRPADSKFNKDFGSVKTADGTLYGYWKDKESEFQVGGVYEIFYEDKEGREGKVYHTIKTVKPSSTTNGAVNKVMEKASYPGVATGVGDRDKNRHIFVCGAINNAVHAGGLEIFGSRDMLRSAIDNLVRAYDTSLLANPQKDADMDDEIPYA